MPDADELMLDADAPVGTTAVPDKPTLPKAPKQPKQVKDPAENEQRQKEYEKLKVQHKLKMVVHKALMAERAKAQQAARKRSGEDGARRAQQRRAAKAAGMTLNVPFAEAFAALKQKTLEFDSTCRWAEGLMRTCDGWPKVLEAEDKLVKAWEEFLGRSVPHKASLKIGSHRHEVDISFVYYHPGWIESSTTFRGTELPARTRITAAVYVGPCRDGLPHGHGVKLSEHSYDSQLPGFLEDGSWVHGVFSGDGSRCQFDEDGSPLYYCVGTWEHGFMKRGAVTYVPDGDTYDGEFRTKYSITGCAKIDSDGHRITRESWELIRHGQGKYYNPAGKVIYEGEWCRDWPLCEWSQPPRGTWMPMEDAPGFQRYVVDDEDALIKKELTAEENALCDRIHDLECYPLMIDLYCAEQTRCPAERECHGESAAPLT